MLVRDLLRDRYAGYFPVAFVDDMPRRQGGVVHGVPIRGACQDIPLLVGIFGIDLILLATPSATAREMQRLVGLCEAAGKPFRTVPQVKELMAGQVAVNQLRPVSLSRSDPLTIRPLFVRFLSMFQPAEIAVPGYCRSAGSRH